MDIVIAGGGVAGLEALLALGALAGDRARLRLISPDPEFAYKPLAVAEPFALGSTLRVPLERIAGAAGAELIPGAVESVDDAAGEVRLDSRRAVPYDALLLAPGARAVDGVPGATTWRPGGDPAVYGGLLRDLEEGYARKLAIVVPPGATWPLPAYELALMTAGEAAGMGRPAEIVVVTPEPEPLALLGPAASAAVAEELGRAGIALRTGVLATVEDGTLVLEPGGERIEGARIYSVPRLLGPAITGLPVDDEGFVLTDDDARVEGCTRTWAAGDGVRSPLKFGGLATHEARRAVAGIAAALGLGHVPDPGEPVVHGRLLTGHGARRLRGRGDGDAAPLWWPAGKVAGEHLPRWLHEQGLVPQGPAGEPGGGVEVNRTLTALRAVEARYVRELARG
ncbi:MAG: FAD-dependent oxidoreductase [Solirubrobacteraceae bacterium]